MDNRSTVHLAFLAWALTLIATGGLAISLQVAPGNYLIQVVSSPFVIIPSIIGVGILVGILRRECPPPAEFPARLWRRGVAFAIDVATIGFAFMPLLAIVAVFVEYLATGELRWHFHRTSREPRDIVNELGVSGLLAGLLLLVAWPPSKGKQSVGQFLMGIVVLPGTRGLPLVKSVLRALLGYLTLCCGIVSVPMAFSRKDKRMWHDRAFDTYPFEVEKPEAAKDRPYHTSGGERTIRMLLLACIAVGVGVIGWRVVGYFQRQQAMAALRQMGGSFKHDPTIGGLYLDLSDTEASDADLIHLNRVRHLVGLGLTNTRVTSAGLVHLKPLANLKALSLHGDQATEAGLSHIDNLHSLEQLFMGQTDVSDAAMKHLSGLTKLKMLSVRKTAVKDKGLAPLAELRNLKFLWLSNTKITDAGLVHIGNLTNLERLRLSHTALTDEGLVYLKNLKNLEHLVLAGTQVTDAGLQHLKGLTSLQSLALSDTPVADLGLVHLTALPSLSYLLLNDTRVSDAGLEHLTGLRSLSFVDLEGTEVTEAGVAALRNHSPRLDVDW